MSAYLWLALAGAVLLAALVLVLSRLPAPACCGRYLHPVNAGRRGLHLREWHHGFAGALVFVPWRPAQIVGLVLVADDLLGQHVWQFKRPQFRSPLHRIAAVTWYPLMEWWRNEQ